MYVTCVERPPVSGRLLNAQSIIVLLCSVENSYSEVGHLDVYGGAPL